MFKFQNTRLLICKGCYIHVEQKLYLSTGKRINSTVYAVSFIDCKLISAEFACMNKNVMISNIIVLSFQNADIIPVTACRACKPAG